MKTSKYFREDLREAAKVAHRLGFEWQECQLIAGFCVSEVILKLLDDLEELEGTVIRLENEVEDLEDRLDCAGEMTRGDDI